MADIFDAELPGWSEKFNFPHHSPSASGRPNDLEFFEKCIARPAKIWSPGGCAMKAGTAAHKFINDVAVNNQDQGEAMRHAVSLLDEHKCLEHFPDDKTKLDIIRNLEYKSDVTEIEAGVFELTLEHLLMGTREALQGANKIECDKWASVEMPGLKLPYIGQLDIMTGSVVELKTQWPTIDQSGKSKRGFKINSLPAKPKQPHVEQCALYWAWMRQQSENVPIRLIYANCKGFRVFRSEDCEELSPARLNDALEHLRIVAQTREKMMERSDTIKELLELVQLDFSHWMWRDKTPEYKNLAEQSWQQ